MNDPYQDFLTLWGEYHDLQVAAGLLGWDQETMMPPQGRTCRGQVLATLAGIAHRKLVAEEMLEAVAAARETVPADGFEAAQLDEAQRTIDRARRVPSELEEALAASQSAALASWRGARADQDFAAFLPDLERQVGLVRERAAALAAGGDPYDALLEGYEPQATGAALEPLFADMCARLAPIVQAAADSGSPVDESAAHGDFPMEQQRAFALQVSTAMGFDYEAGRLDAAAHPFCSGADPGDVRLTWRWDETDFRPALFGVMHEAGHGMYEQGLPREWRRTPLGRHAGLGIHESQSRLWENLVGRSRAFWEWALPEFRAAFPGSDPNPDALWRALHTCRPSPIRVEADEATYDLHIALRFDVERRLVLGGVEARDLPEAWAAASRELLGFAPADDAEGVLQDIHWGMGLFGYFPTYTLGNIYAAQLYAAAERDLGGLDAHHARGEFAPLAAWLREKVHVHGRRLGPAALVEAATGSAPDPSHLLERLGATVAEVYGVTTA